jgi:AraC-like DNA-binding protein
MEQSGPNSGVLVRAIQSEPFEGLLGRPLGATEKARMWRNDRLKDVELFEGSYVSYEFAKHFHTVPAVGVLETGAMGSYHQNKNHSLMSGSLLMFNPGEVHAPYPLTPDGWSFRMLYLEPALYEKLSSEFRREPINFTQPFAHDPTLAGLLADLHRRLEMQCDSLEAGSLLVNLFAQMVTRYSVGAPAGTVRLEKDKVRRMLDYINENYETDVSLDDLAEVSGFSVFHLLRTFQKTVGITPHRYLTQIRVEMGKRLLQKGRDITDVALQVGFADQSHFTRHFKRILGVTPGQYFPTPRV